VQTRGDSHRRQAQCLCDAAFDHALAATNLPQKENRTEHMGRRQRRKAPSVELIRNKRGEAEHFLSKLKQHHDDLQQRPEKPPPHEFSYNLSAFLYAARSMGKMVAGKSPNWWGHLSTADRALHDRIWNMRDETVYEGHTETIVQTNEVPVRPSHHPEGFLFDQSQFGGVTTYAHTHAINLGGIEHDLVELCSQYLEILIRELQSIEARRHRQRNTEPPLETDSCRRLRRRTRLVGSTMSTTSLAINAVTLEPLAPPLRPPGDRQQQG
jgi:hypothetical protein